MVQKQAKVCKFEWAHLRWIIRGVAEPHKGYVTERASAGLSSIMPHGTPEVLYLYFSSGPGYDSGSGFIPLLPISGTGFIFETIVSVISFSH